MSRIELEDIAGTDGVRVITFNRPEVRNAFDSAMYLEVTEALRNADRDESVGAVVLTGRGSAFTSGQDLAEMAAIATGTATDGAGQGFMGLLETLTELSVPLLAAVNGVAVGLGFTLLAHCDLVLVDESARLRVPFAELGVPPEAASSVLFPARMGWQQAARVLLTSDWVSAHEAVTLGMALRVCAEGTALTETVDLAARIAGHPRSATRAITRLLRAGQQDLVRAANRREQGAFAQLLGGAAEAGALAEIRGQGYNLSMRLGITASLTDRDMSPADLARAAEDRGFDSFFLPEHTHLPLRADQPPGLVEGVRAEDYRRSLCPLVSLSTAVSTTERIRLGTGILLVAQHDPIVLAKQIATLDHLSHGRVTLGIGFGWNRAEAEDHGVDFGSRHALVREYLLCMQALWSQEQAQFHGAFIDLPPTWAWPKTSQQPRPRVLIGGGSGAAVLDAVADYADGWMPIGGGGLGEAIPRLHRLAEEKGRDPTALEVIPFGTVGSPEKLAHYGSLGVTEVILRVGSGPAEEMLSQLDALVPLVDLAATLG